MIGGHDTHVDVQPGTSAAFGLFALRLLRDAWPEAIADDLDGDHGPQPLRSAPPIHGFREILVYRDTASLRAWDAFGATSETNNSMIHILADDAGLTFVVDAETSAAGQLVQEVVAAIRNNRHAVRPASDRSSNPPEVAPCPP